MSIVSVMALVSCSADSILAPPTDLGPLYWELRVNYPAVRLSLTNPYDTLQIEAVPYTTDGSVWAPTAGSHPKIGVPMWVSDDSAKVSVSATGRLTAKVETGGVFVSVSQQIDNVTRKDSVFVQVVNAPTPPILTTFSVRPTDSLKRGMGSLSILPVIALDEHGNAIDGLPIKYFTSDRKNVSLSAGTWSGVFRIVTRGNLVVEEVKFRATTWVYGVSKTDTFTMQLGWNVTAPGSGGSVNQMLTGLGIVDFTVYGGRSDIGPGGYVRWENRSGYGPTNVRGKPARAGEIMDVIFDDSTAALPMLIASQNSGGGNIRAIPSDTTFSSTSRQRLRRFLTPGEYHYTIQPFGFRGVVVVHDR